MRFNNFLKIKKSNLTKITIKRKFSKRGPGLVCCQRQSTRTSYQSTTDSIQYRINLVHLSTGWIPIENQYHSQLLARPLNCSWVECLHHMPLWQHTCFYKFRFPDNKHINKWGVTWQTWTLHQSSNTERFYAVKLDTSLVYIDQLYLDKFMKTINIFSVGIPTPEKNI